MGCCDEKNPVSSRPAGLTIALAGNPNSGKSALFNALTGIRQKTGNWPGVTVERKEGRFDLGSERVRVIDLPGIYSLDATSLDEKLTRDYLLSHDADIIVNVIDATNLERNLYLTVQMLEMGVPIIIALNMMDVARRRGLKIDTETLSQKLGAPVVPVVAVSGEGLDQLKQELQRAFSAPVHGYTLAHDEVVEQAVSRLREQLPDSIDRINKHWLALKMLEGDDFALQYADDAIQAEVDKLVHCIADRAGEDPDMLIADTRYSHAHAIAQQAQKEAGKLGKTLTDKIDKIVLSPLLGIPIFLFVMYLMFLFAINLGGAFVDFFDGAAQAIFVDGFGQALTSMGLPEWLVVLLANGAGGGLQIVATFIPIIAGLYLFLSAVEDSGYMARAAFVMDKSMRAIGLPGKAFVPLIVGFGCNVPAIMATRTLENERERKLTMLMNPFMSCGARLPVYVLFAAAFFPRNGQNLVFGLYVIGIIAAIGTGLLMKKTLLPGVSTGFMMELPPYHVPKLKGILLRTWDRLKGFIKDAGKVIIVMVMVINTLSAINMQGRFAHGDTENSVLGVVSQTATPLFAPLGVREDNWPAVLGIFTGIMAKEVVVGTLDAIYTQLAEDDAGIVKEEKAFDLWQSIKDAAATIPENLAGVKDALLDPLGLGSANITTQEAAAEESGVDKAVFGAMVKRFDGQIGAFAYLLFVLLYFPCVATIGAISREAGLRWALFTGFWTTSTAWVVSVMFYQIATWNRHPTSSIAWVIGLFIYAAILIIGLKKWGEKGSSGEIPVRVGA